MQTDISEIRAWIPAIIITTAIIVFGVLLQKLASVYFHRLARKDRWRGGLVFVSSLKGMVVLVSIVAGLYIGLLNSPLKVAEMQNIAKLHSAILSTYCNYCFGQST